MKKCNTCKEVKNLNEFNKCNGNPDKLQYQCRICSNKGRREWRLSNKKHCFQKDQQFYKDNPEYFSQWVKANPDKRKEYSKTRRTLKKLATVKWYNKQSEQKFKDFKALMEKTFKEDFSMDHIIPLNHPKICGLHCEDNWQTLPIYENKVKKNKWDGTYDNLSWKQDLNE